ncbi:MAG TPA: hypothetical protein VHM30_10400 [Gemmatimonadaceae bacterium]|nr:hypothetical protein [Gemmatimonadaceae bacterium]
MSAILGAAVLLQVVATSKPAVAPTSGRQPDSSAVALDSLVLPDTAQARLAFDFGSGIGAPVVARKFEFAVTSAPAAPAHNRSPASALLRVVRPPDTLSAELARRVLDGGHIPEVAIRLPGRDGQPGSLVHLFDVQVLSSKLVSSEDKAGLIERRLALDESIDQLSAELDESQRQLGVTESLRKRDLSTSLELARARAATGLLTRRLAIQRHRLAMLMVELSRWTPVEEESVLTAARVVIDDR